MNRAPRPGQRRGVPWRRSESLPRRVDPGLESRCRVPWWLVVPPLVLLGWLLFLRGPNGLARIAGNWQKVRAGDARLGSLHRQVDSLESLKALLSDTAFVRRYAAGVLGADSTPPDDSLP
ncbi:MAG: hypothetical protein R6X12_10195 [bacterium]